MRYSTYTTNSTGAYHEHDRRYYRDIGDILEEVRFEFDYTERTIVHLQYVPTTDTDGEPGQKIIVLYSHPE